MQIVNLKQFKKTDRYKKIMNRGKENYEDIFGLVQDIMKDVRKNGDKAVKKYTERFDKLNIQDTKVKKEEIQKAYTKVSKEFLRALEQTIKNITKVHQNQIPINAQNIIKPEPGIRVWKKWQPIEKVGLYVPGGRALYPSSVLMNAIPAIVAGCKQIIITTPPQKNGLIAPELLVAANKLGITEIYKIGGIQAIAALTYGTEIVPKVYKVVGPGNAYVTAAKLAGLMSGEIAIDSPAGPSEVFVIADEAANPKFVAADLMADAEHGPDSAPILITTSKKLAEKIWYEIKKNINKFDTQKNIQKSMKRYGLFALVTNIEEAIEFANDYAPEHIQIMTKNAQSIAKKITNAGSIFIGDYTCKSAGDYATGANHVLPTGGSAKMFSGLSVLDFVRLVEYQKCSKEGLEKISKSIQTFAEIEGLPAHKYSCNVRFE
ncbi:MAG: histidinol dehydrogenase [Candidatus Magasanikbacteria bacterium]|jgi:histidinol dehydrogenase|nr:histidinol dehydrogenase [Candidatus Magasanikbacteria bacterium]MBT4314869.1 histidinol dehydrogenase [Candidatus Magasanikbacteria bacterium]MBT4546744.1 histidinol dehydrogenase [Candidatus Magasanikbacteria bacterium]MBT6819647.1 histidinol dehydrogenase [Candidatus Magasanikbacteria bacterium]